MLTHQAQSDLKTLRILLFCVLIAVSGESLAMTVTPVPSTDGNYTVTWGSGCQATGYPYPYPPYVCHYLYENGVYVSSTSPYTVTGKPQGTYSYTVAEDWVYYINWVDSGSAIVGTPPPRDSIPTQLTYQYQTRAGDINGDGRTDLFVKRTSGGVSGNGVLESVILVQNTSGGFWLLVPNASQSSIASGWPLSSATSVVSDFNVDGYVDVEVKGVATATGVANDQIVYSPGAPLISQPLGLRPVDESLKTFVANMLDYSVNQNYFSETVQMRPFSGRYYDFQCEFTSGLHVGVLEQYSYNMPICYVIQVNVTGTYPDYTVFSQEALAIWSNEQAQQAGAVSPEQSTEDAQQAAEGVLDVQIGGWPMEEVLGSDGEYGDPDIRRGLETFWSILGIAQANAADVHADQAPPQVPRVFDVIFLTGHYVFGYGPIHTAIEYTSAAVPTTTISAAPSAAFPCAMLEPCLVSSVNRPEDRLNMVLGTVSKPGNPAATYFAALLIADKHYPDSLHYTLFPSPGFAQYNSNSYVRGIIDATGGLSSRDLSAFVGGSNVVPAYLFQ